MVRRTLASTRGGCCIFFEIPLILVALFFAALGSTRLSTFVAAFAAGVVGFAVGFLILAWLYRFARRRVENNVTPRRWEYWLEEHGWWFLGPSVAFGIWASQFGANEGWGIFVASVLFMLFAGFIHGFVILTPRQVTESYLAKAREDR